jgi:VanZ family protein
VVGSCEHSNKPSGSIKGREFLDQLNDYQHLKDSAPWNWLVTKIYMKLRFLRTSFLKVRYVLHFTNVYKFIVKTGNVISYSESSVQIFIIEDFLK